jgi:hypothetical protein
MLENNTSTHETKIQTWTIKPIALIGLTGSISTALLLWLLSRYPTGFNSPSTLIALAILSVDTFLLLFLIRNPIPSEAGAVSTQRTRLVFLILACFLVFFSLPAIFRGPILYALPIIAIMILSALKRPIARQEAVYASILAIIAGIIGPANGATKGFTPVVWGILQVFLVLPSLLCGWKILQNSGLTAWRVGYSRLLSGGFGLALRGLGLGVLLAIPWAIGNVIIGGAAHDTWVTAWWQPLAAIQPGIAEEAWGRLLITPILYLIFRLATRPRMAFAIALIFQSYWFAYLHTQMGLEGVISTIMICTLYGLPIAYLCLYRDLETAIGWHFTVDFVRFLSAFIVYSRI